MMNFYRSCLLFRQLLAVLVVFVFLSNKVAYSEPANNNNGSPNSQATFTIIDDESALLEEASPQNGTRKVGRSLLSHPRNQRASSFRLEDNGSKLHYMRTVPHNDLFHRGELERIILDPSVEADLESGALFCYHQSVQVGGYELGPTVTKCTVPGHDACMLLENTRSGVREMSCMSSSDCELTRYELSRYKVDGSVRLTCCKSNLCNSPVRPTKQSNERHGRQQASRARVPNLRDRNPFQAAIEDPLFPGAGGFLHDPAFMGRSSADMAQMQLTPSGRSSRPNARSSVLSSPGLRQAASLLDRTRTQKSRPTTPAYYWNNMPGASLADSSQIFQETDMISALINRVINGHGRLGKPAAVQQQPPQRQNRPPSPSFSPPSDFQKQQQNQPSEQDLYQQMMLLLGEVGASNKNNVVGSQRQRVASETSSNFGSSVLAPNVCDFPPLMPNAWVSVSSLEVGSEVYYQCSAGYQLDGPRVVTCTEQPSGTTLSPLDGRLAEKILHAHPRWTQVPNCVRASELGDKISNTQVSDNEVASHIMSRSNSNNNNNYAGSLISEHFKSQLPDVRQAPVSGSETVMSYSSQSVASDEVENQPSSSSSSAVDLPSDARRNGGAGGSSASDRVTQCYDNRAGSVFVASCRGDSVICTRIVTTGTSAVSLLSSPEAPGGASSLTSFNAESSSPVLSDAMPGSSRSSSSGQPQQQVSQYCALLDDCLRFERWVRLANRDDIDVLCCSTDLCNA